MSKATSLSSQPLVQLFANFLRAGWQLDDGVAQAAYDIGQAPFVIVNLEIRKL